MLTKEELLVQNTLPNISDISLSLYAEFAENVLLNRRFHYFFTDDTDIIVEFKEWGIYHMLSIQHINSRIKNDLFFQAIHNGLDLNSFEENNAVRKRYKEHKTRITAFSCIYHTLINGKAFYLPSGEVKNTAKVRADYILFDAINEKGINFGLKKVGNSYVPITILIARTINKEKYLEDAEAKIVKRLEIIDENETILQTITH